MISVLLLAFLPLTFSAQLSTKQYGVAGDVTISDNKVTIKSFSYTGQAPDAFFYIGTSGRPENAGQSGIRIQYPAGSDAPLARYEGQEVSFSLPAGLSAEDVTWVSVWCRDYSIDFGHTWLTDDIPSTASSFSVSTFVVALLSWVVRP